MHSPNSSQPREPAAVGSWTPATLLLHHSRTPSKVTGGPRLFPASPWVPLKMSPFDSWGLFMAFLALLCCPGSGKEAFEKPTWTKQLVVESGRSQVINCSASCTQPENSGLETTVSKKLLKEGAQWKLYEVNVSQDTILLCYFTCFGRQEIKRFNISVFSPPKQVLLTLQPTFVTVGTWFTIECRVPSVAPFETLTITLLRGSEILYNETLRGTTPSPQEAIVTHNTTALRKDGHHNFTCQAKMDLQSRGGHLIHRVSDPQVLEVYEPFQDSQMAIIIAVVSVLLFLFVASVLLCFVLGEHWRQRRTGSYMVQAVQRRLRWCYQAQLA